MPKKRYDIIDPITSHFASEQERRIKDLIEAEDAKRRESFRELDEQINRDAIERCKENTIGGLMARHFRRHFLGEDHSESLPDKEG